jgi:hypothetical protein
MAISDYKMSRRTAFCPRYTGKKTTNKIKDMH